MPVIHDLKTLAQFWDAVYDGKKTFEVRRNDRDFQVGEWLNLIRVEEFGPDVVHAPVMLPGVERSPAVEARLLVVIDYVLTAEALNAIERVSTTLHTDYVVLGIRRL